MLVCFLFALLLVFVQADVPVTEGPTLRALDQSNFKEFTTAHPKFLALLHAPWDSASQRARVEFTAASNSVQKLLSDNGLPPLNFVTVDCTASTRLCQQFGSKGFPPPRMGIFNLTNPQTDLKIAFSDVHPKMYTKHFYETIAISLRDNSKDFNQHYERLNIGKHHIRHLNRKLIKKFELDYPEYAILVLYYSHTCSHSSNFIRTYADASNLAKKQHIPVKFTSINCARPGNNEYCTEMEVARYPSVQYFSTKINGQRSAEGSGDFIENINPGTDLMKFLATKVGNGLLALPEHATEL